MTLAFIFDGAGFGEWLVLLAVLLVVVGPKNLPSVARKIGQHYAKLRRMADGFRRQIMEMDREIDKAVSDAERDAQSVFTIEGDESKAMPLDLEGAGTVESKAAAAGTADKGKQEP